MQIAGEETLQAMRNANDALVEISSEAPASSRRDKRRREAAEREVKLIQRHKSQCLGRLRVAEAQL